MEDKDFKDWLSSYTDYDKCCSAFQNQKEFFRVNTIKNSVEQFQGNTKLKVKQSEYYNAAFELEEKIQIGKTWEYFLGLIYPQSLSSILVSLAMKPEVDDVVLDVAASPGSKFSHMAMLMKNRGVLVGNDLSPEKISALYATINRLNLLNCIVTMHNGATLNWKSRFTKILLDAPCTALGSGAGASTRWELDHSQKISSLQKRMLFSAFDALRPGGEIVYSTCTYAKEENEEVIANLLNNVHGVKLMEVGLEIPHESGLSEYGNEFKKCYRIYPQHLQSEGFFIARLKKGE
ncbi:tRNA (cytosine(49)-C(5))-methyltransferase [Candidatus Bilamarchaeum dharawalense]|uniref:tRNA (Cytosine(49)-C(5))-methyltransferase n=1 Tax=Candidatus Bilamarchaeum dharawalense TaxID=2885759 RepID=A0A5E4LNF7_9ARCH|nr:tRNA (cytosine(49)-C(5))-methyltransferase [Candidatus Bilamarchaeum dharawalense]